AIYPLRTMLANAFHYSTALALVVALATALRGFPGPWALLSLAPTFLLLLLLGWSLATFFGLLNVCFRHTSHVSELAFQALFYLPRGICGPVLGVARGLGALVWYNPVVPFPALPPQPLLYGTVPAWTTYGSAAGVAFVATGAAALLLWHQERRLIFLLYRWGRGPFSPRGCPPGPPRGLRGGAVFLSPFSALRVGAAGLCRPSRGGGHPRRSQKA